MSVHLLWLSPLPALTAESLFETTVIFPVTPKNKPNYRIPSIIQAPNGDLLIIAEKRNDGPGDVGNHDIVLKRSRDQGGTWGAEQVPGNAMNAATRASPITGTRFTSLILTWNGLQIGETPWNAAAALISARPVPR